MQLLHHQFQTIEVQLTHHAMEKDSVKSKSPMAAFCYTLSHLKA